MEQNQMLNMSSNHTYYEYEKQKLLTSEQFDRDIEQIEGIVTEVEKDFRIGENKDKVNLFKKRQPTTRIQ